MASFDKNLSISLSMVGQEDSDTFNTQVKYARGGYQRILGYVERDNNRNELILKTDDLFGDLPDPTTQYSIIWFFKNRSTIGVDLEIKRAASSAQATASFERETVLYPGEVYFTHRGRLAGTGFEWRLSLQPLDGRGYGDLTDDEKLDAYVEIVAYAIDQSTYR